MRSEMKEREDIEGRLREETSQRKREERMREEVEVIEQKRGLRKWGERESRGWLVLEEKEVIGRGEGGVSLRREIGERVVRLKDRVKEEEEKEGVPQ